MKDYKSMIASDSYLKPRKDPTQAQLRLYLREVNYHCPLCGKELQSRKQQKSNSLFEIPRINKPDKIIIPSALIPFSQRNRSDNYKEFVHFYEHDKNFATVLTAAKEHIDTLKNFQGVVSPDCSLYRDMPLVLQIANTYMNRAIGYYLQSHGVYVIPNIRWGDERSYTTIELPEKFAFTGVDKHGIVSIGTYGCIKSRENKQYFAEGLEAMLDELEPEVVLVYGGMPDSIFKKFKDRTEFVNYPDWTSTKKRRSV